MSYCYHCKHQKKEGHMAYYDTSTGKRVMIEACMNIKCPEGCGNIGHVYSGFLLWRKCINCNSPHPNAVDLRL